MRFCQIGQGKGIMKKSRSDIFGRDRNMWVYIIIASLIVLGGAVIAYQRRNNIRSMSLAFSTALSFAIMVLVFPYYRALSDLPIAVIESIRSGLSGIAMGGDGDIPYALELERNEFLVYRFFLYSLYVIGPICGSLFLFSFSSKVRNLFSFLRQKRFHVFSDLNERSIRIAESIVDLKEGKPVFCNATDADADLTDRARAIDALLMDGSQDGLILMKNKKYEYYEIDEDDRTNVRNTADLCQKLKKKKNFDPESTVIRVFAGDSQRELILNLDRQYAGGFYLRHIDTDSTLAIEALDLARDLLATKKDCNVALVSDSMSSIELLKGLVCLLIKPEGKNRITVIGSKADRLYEQYRSETYDADKDPIEVLQCDAGKEAGSLERIPDAVFILCEQDEYAYETAVQIKRTLGSKNRDLCSPKIFCRIKDSNLHSILKEEDIVLFGNTEKADSYERLINPELEKAAKRVHLSYLASGTKEDIDPKGQERRLRETGFYQYQNQESSFAMALALRYKERYILSYRDDETVGEKTFIENWLSEEENMKKMADAEHDRWCAYQRTHGWKTADAKQTAAIIDKYKGNRANDPELRLHPAIVSNAKLETVEKRVNRLLKEYGSDYRVFYLDADRDIIRRMTYILERR